MRPLPRATARSLQLLELRLGSHAAPGEGGDGGEGAEGGAGGAGGEGAARVPRVVPREPDPVRRVWVRPAHVALHGQSAPPPPPWQRPSSAPAPPQGARLVALGGSALPRGEAPAHWSPSTRHTAARASDPQQRYATCPSPPGTLCCAQRRTAQPQRRTAQPHPTAY